MVLSVLATWSRKRESEGLGPVDWRVVVVSCVCEDEEGASRDDLDQGQGLLDSGCGIIRKR